ncbi:recombinase RecT [Streptomyces hiroshimensis]|uniref:DNA recombination protein RecT n=1 Tax=Streptomyces hiroshimensis TaxID=66424 RepID=A0ABQ2Y440_9ACTN|nr:recombinase RecT [Streptomyces hiroshimensis]GGX63382.1 DNA recombination protein RecT [Streptomyces hiroshimensis]
MTSPIQNAVAARQRQQHAQVTLADQVEAMRPEIARVLPAWAQTDADRMARVALTVLRRTPKLQQTIPESFLGSLMTCAQLGVEPGPLGEAYLVPYGRECTFVLGYRGMVKLWWASPIAKTLDARVVYEGDVFRHEYGLAPSLVHRPALTGRGRPVAYYAVATTTRGGSAFVVLPPEEIERHRKHSRSADSGPWRDHYEAMAKKTAVRELFKLLPTGTALSRALAHDGTVRTDRSPDAIDASPDLPEVIDGEVIEQEAEAA